MLYSLTLFVWCAYMRCMAKAKTLSPNDRAFFELASRAAFCNPFSDDRVRLDLKIADCSPEVSVGVRIERAVEKVKERVKRLEAESGADINLYSGDERTIMQSAFMYSKINRCCIY